MENLSFLDGLRALKEKSKTHRMHRASKPGVLAWLANDNLESNFPISFLDYFADDWTVIEDNTVIR